MIAALLGFGVGVSLVFVVAAAAHLLQVPHRAVAPEVDPLTLPPPEPRRSPRPCISQKQFAVALSETGFQPVVWRRHYIHAMHPGGCDLQIQGHEEAPPRVLLHRPGGTLATGRPRTLEALISLLHAAGARVGA